MGGEIPADKQIILSFTRKKNLIKYIGIDEDRFQVHSISASEGKQFAELIKNFTKKIIELGELTIPKKSGMFELERICKNN